MADEQGTPSPAPQTVIVDRSGSGGGGGFGMVLVGLALLIAVLIGGYVVMNMNKNDAKKTDAITGAAEKVGSSAEKVANKIAP